MSMDALGLGEELRAASVRARAVALKDGLTGTTVLRMGMEIPYPALGWHFLHRADLIDILANGAREAAEHAMVFYRKSAAN